MATYSPIINENDKKETFLLLRIMQECGEKVGLKKIVGLQLICINTHLLAKVKKWVSFKRKKCFNVFQSCH